MMIFSFNFEKMELRNLNFDWDGKHYSWSFVLHLATWSLNICLCTYVYLHFSYLNSKYCAETCPSIELDEPSSTLSIDDLSCLHIILMTLIHYIYCCLDLPVEYLRNYINTFRYRYTISIIPPDTLF